MVLKSRVGWVVVLVLVLAFESSALAKPPAKKEFSSAFWGFSKAELQSRFENALIYGSTHADKMSAEWLRAFWLLERGSGFELGATRMVMRSSGMVQFFVGTTGTGSYGMREKPQLNKSFFTNVRKAKDPAIKEHMMTIWGLVAICEVVPPKDVAVYWEEIINAAWKDQQRMGLLQYMALMRDKQCLLTASYDRMAKPLSEWMIARLDTVSGFELVRALTGLVHAGYLSKIPHKHIQRFVNQQNADGTWSSSDPKVAAEGAVLGAYVIGQMFKAANAAPSIETYTMYFKPETIFPKANGKEGN